MADFSSFGNGKKPYVQLTQGAFCNILVLAKDCRFADT
jgi:hypothetical protein